MAIALIILALVIITVLFHLFSPWWLTPLASNWDSIDTTIEISFWITGAVFVAVNVFLAWVVLRYRHNNKTDNKAHYEPENKPLEGWLIILTTIGVIAMLTPGLIVWGKFVEPPEDAMVVEAIGQQWQWTFRFPGVDGKLGGADARFVTAKNPYGVDPADPDGQDDRIIASQRLHLPVNQSVKLYLRSNDVLHNFAVPQFRVKMDLVPGTETYQWFEPTHVGRYEILCEELCGIAHYTMRGEVVVDEQQDFDRWLAQQPTFAQTQRDHPVDLIAGEQLYTTCATCHGSDGTGNAALQAPNLTGLTVGYMQRQLRYFRDGIRGAHPQDMAGRQMAAMASVVAGEDLYKLLDYIASLPVKAVARTLNNGTADKGLRVYQSCALCHGDDGAGKQLLGAPRLAGQADWYLRGQLRLFSLGWRGKHPQDQFGGQMRFMTRTIQNPQRLDDLLAYIATLSPDSNLSTASTLSTPTQWIPRFLIT